MRLPILVLAHIATAHRHDLRLTATTGEGANTSSIAATALQNFTAVVGTHGSDRGVLSRVDLGIPGKLRQRLALILAASTVPSGPLRAVEAWGMPRARVAAGSLRNALSGPGYRLNAMEDAGPGSGIADPWGFLKGLNDIAEGELEIELEDEDQSLRGDLDEFLRNNVDAEAGPWRGMPPFAGKWEDLTEDRRADASAIFGYTQDTWDSGYIPIDVDDTDWADIPEQTREALMRFGYTQELWYETKTFLDTQALSVQTREAVVASGYGRDIISQHPPSASSSGIDIDVDDLLQQSDYLDDPSSTTPFTKEEEIELSKQMIRVSASIKLPVSADLAFDAFSDLPRQPSWSSWLHSVSYIDDGDLSQMQYSEGGIPMRPTKWLMKWGKLRYGWDSQVIRVERPNIIEWESTSGLKNMGVIEFSETMGSAGAGGYTGVLTDVTISFQFMAPRLVARVLRKSKRISAFMEQKVLMPMLVKFRDVLMEKDLGMDVESRQRILSTLEDEV